MKANEVMRLLNIKSRNTLSKYVKEGLIKVRINPKGRYIYEDDSVYQFIGLKKEKKDKINISYSRVSTPAQKNQLKDQTKRIYESCISKGIRLDLQLEDIKSGMSSDRKAFQELIQKVIKGEVDLVVVENKDRLIRFNFDLLESIFKYFGTRIVVLNDTLDNKSYEQELMDDLISIIHYFSMKSYSHRRKLNKIRKELEENKSTIKYNDTN